MKSRSRSNNDGEFQLLSPACNFYLSTKSLALIVLKNWRNTYGEHKIHNHWSMKSRSRSINDGEFQLLSPGCNCDLSTKSQVLTVLRNWPNTHSEHKIHKVTEAWKVDQGKAWKVDCGWITMASFCCSLLDEFVIQVPSFSAKVLYLWSVAITISLWCMHSSKGCWIKLSDIFTKESTLSLPIDILCTKPLLKKNLLF